MKKKEQSGHDEDMGIVILVRNGGVEEFEKLVEKYQKRMLNIAYRMVGNYEDEQKSEQKSGTHPTEIRNRN